MPPTPRIHPVWEPASRPLAPPPEDGPTTRLRHEIATLLGVDPRPLVALDGDGREVDLDQPVPATGTEEPGLTRLAISVIPFVRSEGWIGASTPHREDADPATGPSDPAPEPSDLTHLAAAERVLARGLAGLGVHLGERPEHLEELIDAFPELPSGYGLRSRSPYRFFFATACSVETRRADELETLETAIERMTERLSTRLRLRGGADLDTRLHLLVSQDPSDRAALARYLSQGPRPAAPGRSHRGWRRVVVLPHAGETDRLGQIAGLGQRLALERTEPALRHRLQGACGDFAPVHSQEGWLDHQAQILLRPVEERLHAIARERLAARLVRALDAEPLTGTESARDLARRLLTRSGLLAVRFEDDGPRIDDLARTWCDPAPPPRFGDGGPPADEAREWLAGVAADSGPGPVAAERTSRAARTAAVAAACRLRQALESTLEREVFPQLGGADLGFSRWLAGLSTLAGELQAIGVQDGDPHRLEAWLRTREERWREEAESRRQVVLRAAAPLDLWWHRILRALGLAPRRLADRVDRAAQEYVESRALWSVAESLGKLTRDGELGRLFGGVLEIVARLEALAPAARQLEATLAREARSHEALLALQTGGLEAPVPGAIRERLDRAVERIDLAPALGAALRGPTGGRDLMRLSPDAVVNRAWSSLARSLDEVIGRLAAETDLPLIDGVIESGLRTLFDDGAVPHTGPDGKVGALDARTHLLAIASPDLLARDGEAGLAERLRRHLPALGVRRDLPIEVASSPGVPGLFLVRCVHGLSPREVTT